MLQGLTVRNINFAVSLFLSFTPVDSALKILFSNQVLSQQRKKHESYKENIILSGKDLTQPVGQKHSKPEVRCSMLYHRLNLWLYYKHCGLLYMYLSQSSLLFSKIW